MCETGRRRGKKGGRVERRRGSLGRAYLFPTLSVAGASLSLPSEEGPALDIGIATTNSEDPQYSTKSIIKLVPSLILLFFFARLPVRVAPLLQTSRAAALETRCCITAGPSISKGTVVVSRA